MINREFQPIFEARTFLLMLAAFIGNATVFDLDIVLIFILPTVLLLQMKQRWSIPKQSLMPLLGVILLGSGPIDFSLAA